MLTPLSPNVHFKNYAGGVLSASANGNVRFRQLAEHFVTMLTRRERRIRLRQEHRDTMLLSTAYRGMLAVGIPDGPGTGTLIKLDGSSACLPDGRPVQAIVDRS